MRNHRGDAVQLFRVDDGAPRIQGHRRTRIAGAPPAGNKAETALDAGADDGRYLGLRVRGDDDKRHVHAPVGGIRGMGYPGQTAKVEIVRARDAPKGLAYFIAAPADFGKPVAELPHRHSGRLQESLGSTILVQP